MRQTEIAALVLVEVQKTYPDAALAFDPLKGLERSTLSVYVIPDNMDFLIGDSNKRKHVIGLKAYKYITVALSKGYVGQDEVDVGPWAESKELLDDFEDMAVSIIKVQYPGIRIQEAELLRADGESLDNQIFYTALSLGFEDVC